MNRLSPLCSGGRSGRKSVADAEMKNAAGQRNLSGRMVSDDEEWVSAGAAAVKENCGVRE